MPFKIEVYAQVETIGPPFFIKFLIYDILRTVGKYINIFAVVNFLIFKLTTIRIKSRKLILKRIAALILLQHVKHSSPSPYGIFADHIKPTISVFIQFVIIIFSEDTTTFAIKNKTVSIWQFVANCRNEIF